MIEICESKEEAAAFIIDAAPVFSDNIVCHNIIDR